MYCRLSLDWDPFLAELKRYIVFPPAATPHGTGSTHRCCLEALFPLSPFGRGPASLGGKNRILIYVRTSIHAFLGSPDERTRNTPQVRPSPTPSRKFLDCLYATSRAKIHHRHFNGRERETNVGADTRRVTTVFVCSFGFADSKQGSSAAGC